jgi:hypothetical protein
MKSTSGLGGGFVFRVLWIATMGLLVTMFIVHVVRRRVRGESVFVCKNRSERICTALMWGVAALIWIVGVIPLIYRAIHPLH